MPCGNVVKMAEQDVEMKDVIHQAETPAADKRKVGIEHTHRGDILGIHVCQEFANRQLVANYLVHRAGQAGICGSAKNGGAVSIVIGGGYTNDDNGLTVTYIGSGPDNADQVFTRTNLAMAETCDADNNPAGAVARDWKNSKAIRVIRGPVKGTNAKNIAPEKYYRYDGLYKVKEYIFEDSGRGGNYKVYKFKLKRDDTTEPPWTVVGQERVRELGLIKTGGFREKSASSKKAKTAKVTTVPKPANVTKPGTSGKVTKKQVKSGAKLKATGTAEADAGGGEGNKRVRGEGLRKAKRLANALTGGRT